MFYGLRPAYRLVIAGCPLEAVTYPAQERVTTDGRERVQGLRLDGLTIEDESDLATATIEASGITVSIIDRQRDLAWTEALTRHPRVTTTLDDDIPETGVASFGVASVEGFAVGDFIHINTECLEITGRVVSPPSFTCGRARRDTTLQRHFVVSTNGEDIVAPEVLLEHPRSLEGRRVFLYRYVDGIDDFQGNGRIVWRGVITSDAELAADGATWSIQADPITALWDSDLGEQLEEEFGIEGITYSTGAPFRMQLAELAAGGGFSGGIYCDVRLVGHYADQEAFRQALNAAIDASIASIGATTSMASSPKAVVTPDGRWGLQWTAGASPLWQYVTLLDGAELLDGRVLPVDGDGALFTTVAPVPGQTYTYRAGYAVGGGLSLSTVPRATWGGDIGPDAPAFYPGVIYYQASRRIQIDPADDVQISLTYEGIARDFGVEKLTPPLNTSNFSTSEPRYIETGEYSRTPIAWVNGSLPTFRIRDVLLRGDATSGTLDHLRQRLIALGPAQANAGNVPFLVAQDFAIWTDVVDEATSGSDAFFSRRRLVQTQAAEVGDVLANEAQLIGCYFRLNDRGAVELRPVLPLAQQLLPAATLGPSVVLTSQPARWQRAPFGFFSEGRLKTGYDEDEDEHTGPTFFVRSREAMGSRKIPKELVIEPLSSAVGGPPSRDEQGAELAADIFKPIFGLLGQPYAVVEITVPSIEPGTGTNLDLLAACLVGEVVSITSHRLPNAQGGRGITGARALIISRSWDLRSEQGTLRCILSEAPVAGYTPSVRLVSVVSGGGTTTQVLEVDFLDPILGSISLAPDGAVLSDFFAVDDRVEHMPADATSQTPRPGTITAVDDGAGTLSVTLDAAATLSVGYLRFASADDTALSALQRGFAYWGDSRGYVQDGSGGSAIAKRFA